MWFVNIYLALSFIC